MTTVLQANEYGHLHNVGLSMRIDKRLQGWVAKMPVFIGLQLATVVGILKRLWLKVRAIKTIGMSKFGPDRVKTLEAKGVGNFPGFCLVLLP